MYVCICNKISEHDVQRMIDNGANIKRPEDLHALFQCTPQCNSCIPNIVKQYGLELDIHCFKDYPANILSNLHPYEFTIDGIECASIEGWLQSLKCNNIQRQREICKLAGRPAKRAGRDYPWSEFLHWNGVLYNRFSEEYSQLIHRAYHTLAEQNLDFKQALVDTKDYKLVHSIGKSDPYRTIMTVKEFISALNTVRETVLSEDVIEW